MNDAGALGENSRRTMADLYAAGAEGDFARLIGHLDPAVVIHEPPFLPYGGVYRGIEGFQRLMAGISKFLDLGTLRVDHLIADGERVMAILRATDTSGKPVLLAEESTLRLGKVVEMRIFYHDAGTVIGK